LVGIEFACREDEGLRVYFGLRQTFLSRSAAGYTANTSASNSSSLLKGSFWWILSALRSPPFLRNIRVQVPKEKELKSDLWERISTFELQD
jgi:hypothetical protein